MPLIPELQPFITALNNDPTDWQTVGVLGDFLQDRAEVLPKAWVELAPGFLALAHHKRQPHKFNGGCWGWLNTFSAASKTPKWSDSVLHEWWFDAIETGRHILEGTFVKSNTRMKDAHLRGLTILKAAARAFVKLSPKWQKTIMEMKTEDMETGVFE